MKEFKNFIGIVIIAIIIWCGFLDLYYEHNYKMKGITSEFTIIDEVGKEWSYPQPYKVGTPIIIYFNDNGTDSRYDDKIIKIVLDK